MQYLLPIFMTVYDIIYIIGHIIKYPWIYENKSSTGLNCLSFICFQWSYNSLYQLAVCLCTYIYQYCYCSTVQDLQINKNCNLFRFFQIETVPHTTRAQWHVAVQHLLATVPCFLSGGVSWICSKSNYSHYPPPAVNLEHPHHQYCYYEFLLSRYHSNSEKPSYDTVLFNSLTIDHDDLCCGNSCSVLCMPSHCTYQFM